MNQKISLSLYKNATLIKSEPKPHCSTDLLWLVCLLHRPSSSPTSAVYWSRWERGRNRSASWRDACAGWHRSGRQLPGGWMTNYATSGEGRKGWAWDHPDTPWQKKPSTGVCDVGFNRQQVRFAKSALLYLHFQKTVMLISLFRHERKSLDQSFARQPASALMSTHVTAMETAVTFCWNNILLSYRWLLAVNGWM